MEMKQQDIRRKSAVCGLQSAVCRSGASVCGFTLIELLVAMGILMMIVLMMANIFKQSTIAWESGTRQAEAGLEARAVIGMIQHELSQAVGGPGHPFTLVTANGRTEDLKFWTLGESSATNREAREVRYSFTGSQVSRNGIRLIENVDTFTVVPDPDTVSTNAPPAWVEVSMVVSANSDLSQVRVYAIGHEGVADTQR
jgi:type II secretory pathway pseudopilin PulG